MKHGTHVKVGILLLSILLVGLCSCKPQKDTTLKIVDDTEIEIAKDLYTFTMANTTVLTEAQCRDIATRLSDIFDVQVDEGTFFPESGMVQYITETDGAILVYAIKSVYYEDASVINCAVATSRGQAERLAVVDLNEADAADTATYEMPDYPIADAVSYVQELWDSTLSQYSTAEEAVVSKVIVYEREDGSISYVLLMDKLLEGVAIEQYSTMAQMSSRDLDKYGFRKSFVIFEMDSPDHISLYCDYYPYTITDKEPIEEVMDQEEAYQRAADVLAQYTDYTVLEVSLKYACLTHANPETFQYEPYWCFVLEKSDQADSTVNYEPNVTLFVNAQDGSAYLVDSITYTEIQKAP